MPIPTQDPIVIAPSPTPFRDDDSVDYGAIERNVQRWLDTPLSGFVLNSENGEEAFLSEAERLEIVRTVDRVRAGQKILVGGVDNPSVTETLRMAEALVEAGVELLRIRIPRLTANVRGYFEEVVPRAAAPVVIIHQMAPGMFLSSPTSVGASAEVMGELLALDNVYGYITSSDMRFESRVRQFAPPDKRFWACNGALLLAGAVHGFNGACMMFGNISPQKCHDIFQKVLEGDLSGARSLQAQILEADWQILSRRVPGLKAALDLLEFDVGFPRSPTPACDAAGIERIRQAMQNAGILD